VLYCQAGLDSRTLRKGVENELNYCFACFHQTDGIARIEFLDKGNSHNFYKVIFLALLNRGMITAVKEYLGYPICLVFARLK
jgi:hypothetical protein